MKNKRLVLLPTIAALAAAVIAVAILGLSRFPATERADPTNLQRGSPLRTTFRQSTALVVLAARDQQLAGLIMWAPGALFYLGAALVLAGRWLSRAQGAAARSIVQGTPIAARRP